ncbi:MAG TPA: hypothetical protein VFW46_06705 [Stellaceae bacterium]|nr:hypothetical protein [Stellaceae bacterium]
MTAAEPQAHGRTDRHESFLAFESFRYLKLAALVAVLSLLIYLVSEPYGGRYGGSWAGYVLGTVGALLILWLTWFGYRKRTYAEDHGRLAARLSAHVYLGLALLVTATLHTGFHFGWNIHTLAYALMVLVIVSGAFGVFFYARYPRMMTGNRANMTMQQMLGRIAILNDDLRSRALPLDDETTALVEGAVESTEIGGSVLRQISGHYPNCKTAAAIAGMDARMATVAPVMEADWRQIRVLLDEKAQLLGRVRRDISLKAVMDVWLYFHVPVTFALLAALLAHVVSVFFLW